MIAGFCCASLAQTAALPGVELRGRYTLFAEGCRGSLSQSLMARFDLRRNCDPQTYGIGIKELWDIDPGKHVPGRVLHTQGWPMNESDGGGGVRAASKYGRRRSMISRASGSLGM